MIQRAVVYTRTYSMYYILVTAANSLNVFGMSWILILTGNPRPMAFRCTRYVLS